MTQRQLQTFFMFIFFLLAGMPILYAQAERNTIYNIGIGSFSYTPKDEKPDAGKVIGNIANAIVRGKKSRQLPDYANDVKAAIAKGFGNVKRLQVIDGKTFQEEKLKDQHLLYAEGNIANISAITDGPSLKDRKILKNTAINGYTSIEGYISVVISLKNAYTGAVEDSRTFTVSGTDQASEEKAMSKALVNLGSVIADYYNALFPISASIVERGEVKKEKQKTVYIDLGTDYGVYEDQQFNIYSVKTIAGKEARMEIGRLKVEEVLGEELSLCKVTKGEKEVKTALDEGGTLIVIVRD